MGEGPIATARADRTLAARLGRTSIAAGFVLIAIAAAHLLMVVINTVDAQVSAAYYAGAEYGPARYHGERTPTEELERLGKRASTPGERAAVQAAIVRFQAGDHTLTMPPASPFIVGMAIGLSVLGMLLLALSRWTEDDTTQTVLGIFAGTFLWTGGVEYGLIIGSRFLGVAKNFGLLGDEVVGIYGEYVLLKHTWGFLVLLFAYLLFVESSHCPFFLWFRKYLPLMRRGLAHGRIDNYGPRVAFQYTTTIWTFYVVLLWAYDEHAFGIYSWFTYAVFFGSLATSGYLLVRLWHIGTMGAALRYAIGAVVILFNTFEIMAKWQIFQEPWLVLTPTNAFVFFGGLAFGTFLVIQELRRMRLVAATQDLSQGAR